MAALTCISPIDGRYADKTEPMREHFSEFALIKNRVLVEVQWLLFLAQENLVPQLAPFDEADRATLLKLATEFGISQAKRVKDIERTTNHDVKAVEYYLKEAAAEAATNSKAVYESLEFFHFACTSEDINNLSYAIMLKEVHLRTTTI